MGGILTKNRCFGDTELEGHVIMIYTKLFDMNFFHAVSLLTINL